MSLVDTTYCATWADKSPLERVERTCALFSEIQKMVEYRINLEFGPLSPMEMKRKIAQKLYLTDSQILSLIEKA